MKKIVSYTALFLSITLFLCGCTTHYTNEGEELQTTINSTNSEDNPLQARLDVIRPSAYSNLSGLSLEPGSYISIIGRYSNNSFWNEVEAGAMQAVEDLNTMLGYKGDEKITLTYSAPEICDDVDEQINILDEELSRYPIAIGIAAIDTSACALQFDLAAENSIPIITFDSGSDYPYVASHISTNNIEAAKMAATQLALSIGESGEVAVIVQDSMSMSAADRLKGFQQKLKEEYPEIDVVQVYHMDELETMAELITGEEQTEDYTVTQEDVISYILESHPDLKGIYATNLDATQLAAAAVTSLERTDLCIIGFDGGEEQLELLEEEVIDGLILQNPYGMGYATVIAAARVSLGLNNESSVNTGFTWVTKENMTDETIQGMLY